MKKKKKKVQSCIKSHTHTHNLPWEEEDAADATAANKPPAANPAGLGLLSTMACTTEEAPRVGTDPRGSTLSSEISLS